MSLLKLFRFIPLSVYTLFEDYIDLYLDEQTKKHVERFKGRLVDADVTRLILSSAEHAQSN